jgi:hypothetical protein
VLERYPLLSKLKRTLVFLVRRVFYGEPVSTSPENALVQCTSPKRSDRTETMTALFKTSEAAPDVIMPEIGRRAREAARALAHGRMSFLPPMPQIWRTRRRVAHRRRSSTG